MSWPASGQLYHHMPDGFLAIAAICRPHGATCWVLQVGLVRSSPKWTGFTRFYKTVICMGMHAFHGNGKGSRSAPAIQFIVQPKSLLSGARLRSALRMHCVRSATSLLYRGAHAYKTRPESGHRFTPRLELHVHSAPLSN